MGGMGIKNLFWFSQALAEKSTWRFLHNGMLWGRVMSSKYLPRKNFIEWIRSPRKNTQNVSICWKARVEAFLLIGNHLSWRVGNGKQVRIGEYPWVGASSGFKFP